MEYRKSWTPNIDKLESKIVTLLWNIVNLKRLISINWNRSGRNFSVEYRKSWTPNNWNRSGRNFSVEYRKSLTHNINKLESKVRTLVWNILNLERLISINWNRSGQNFSVEYLKSWTPNIDKLESKVRTLVWNI